MGERVLYGWGRTKHRWKELLVRHNTNVESTCRLRTFREECVKQKIGSFYRICAALYFHMYSPGAAGRRVLQKADSRILTLWRHSSFSHFSLKIELGGRSQFQDWEFNFFFTRNRWSIYDENSPTDNHMGMLSSLIEISIHECFSEQRHCQEKHSGMLFLNSARSMGVSFRTTRAIKTSTTN